MKLFKAVSVQPLMDKNGTYPKVKFYWFVKQRNKALALDFKALIANYESTAEYILQPTQQFLRECFTEPEIKQLRAFLQSRRGVRVQLKVREIALPVGKTGREKHTKGVIPYSQCIAENVLEAYPLSRLTDYWLPFDVWGAYVPLEKQSRDVFDPFLKHLHQVDTLEDLLGPQQL